MNPVPLPTLPLPSSLEGVYFVTLRLSDALPESFGQNLGLQYYTQQLEIAQHPHRTELLQRVRKQIFQRFDTALDLEKYGQSTLLHPQLAPLAADAIQQLNGKIFDLLACTILPNHVHLLFDLHTRAQGTPNALDVELLDCKPLRAAIDQLQNTLEQSLETEFWQLASKSPPTIFHQQRSNGSIQAPGKIWHARSFDFQITNASEFENCVQYILQNPVSAGLSTQWQDWPFLHWKK